MSLEPRSNLPRLPRNFPQVAYVGHMTPNAQAILEAAVDHMRISGPWHIHLFSPGDWPRLFQGRPERLFHGILASIHSNRFAARLRALKIPVVCCSGDLEDPGLPTVRADDETAGRLAANHLLERGYRKFALFHEGPNEPSYARRRIAGFQKAIIEAGHPVEKIRISRPTPLFPGDFQRIGELGCWLRRQPKPLGMLGVTDSSARILLDACLTAQIPVPEEVAVVGIENNVFTCRLSIPELSSVDLDFPQRGRRAVGLLAGWMAGQRPAESQILIPPLGVVPRGSTSLIAIQDPALVRALECIRLRASEPLQVPEIVRASFVSRRKLERLFLTKLRRTIQDEIHRVRVERAKDLLVETTWPIEKISAACGFREPPRLYDVFRRLTGLNPGDYRLTARRGPAFGQKGRGP